MQQMYFTHISFYVVHEWCYVYLNESFMVPYFLNDRPHRLQKKLILKLFCALYSLNKFTVTLYKACLMFFSHFNLFIFHETENCEFIWNNGIVMTGPYTVCRLFFFLVYLNHLMKFFSKRFTLNFMVLTVSSFYPVYFLWVSYWLAESEPIYVNANAILDLHTHAHTGHSLHHSFY
jgi:hypothetical protein